MTYTPDPVDHLDLLVHLHQEDAKEDHGEDHLADGHSRVASVQRRSIADEDYETDELKGKERDRECWTLQKTSQFYQETNTSCLNSSPLLHFAGCVELHYLNSVWISCNLPKTGLVICVH